MKDLWAQFEEEFNRKFTDTERRCIVASSTNTFLDVDLRYFTLGGVTYVKDPVRFRAALLRQSVIKFLKGSGEIE